MRVKPQIHILCLIALALHGLLPPEAWAFEQYRYVYQGETYPYTVKESGENHTFEFLKNPGRDSGRLRAVQHVFASVYGEDAINPEYSDFYMKEGAQCFLFEGRFYSYRACFLPNDYSPGNESRFWGFTTRLPNALWFASRQGLPALLLAGAAFFVLRKKPSA